MVSDFTILLLPIISISHLQMRLTRKIGVSAVFATGFLYVPLSIVTKRARSLTLSVDALQVLCTL